MRAVIYKDKNGYLRRVLVKDEDNDSMARYGVPAGPPDIEFGLDWDAIKREVNNALVSNGSFTWQNVNASQTGIQAATNVLKREIVRLFRQREEDTRKD